MTGEVLLVSNFPHFAVALHGIWDVLSSCLAYCHQKSLGHFSDIAKGTTEVTRSNRPALSPTTLDFLGFLSKGRVYLFLQIFS
jgi:hypothetical protein